MIAPTISTTAATSDWADTAPVAKVGLWLLLAAEMMLFAGLLGAFVVLRAGTGDLFATHARTLDRATGVAGVLSLAIACVVMTRVVHAVSAGWRSRASSGLWGVVALGVGFLVVTAFQWHALLSRVTVVATDGTNGVRYVYDGQSTTRDDGTLLVQGVRVTASRLRDLDVHRLGATDLSASVVPDGPSTAGGWGSFVVPTVGATAVNYGPWKNVFFACFYTITGTVALHVLAAVLATICAAVSAARGTLTRVRAECVATYWAFVAAATGATTALLYWT